MALTPSLSGGLLFLHDLQPRAFLTRRQNVSSKRGNKPVPAPPCWYFPRQLQSTSEQVPWPPPAWGGPARAHFGRTF